MKPETSSSFFHSVAERVIGATIRHAPLANMLMFIILLSGILSARSMLREAFPPVSLDMISVVIPYPGADVAEVEEGVSRKIEEAIDGLEGVERYTTTSREGVAQAVRQGSVNLSGGSLRTKSEQINIRTAGRKYTGDPLAVDSPV